MRYRYQGPEAARQSSRRPADASRALTERPQGSVALRPLQVVVARSRELAIRERRQPSRAPSRSPPPRRDFLLVEGDARDLPSARAARRPRCGRARQPKGSPLQGRKVTMSSAVTVVSMSDSGDMDAPKYKSPRPDATPPASIKPDADVAARFRAAAPRRGAGRTEATPRTASSRRRPRRRRCRSRRRAGRRGAARPSHRRTTTRRLETSSTP